MTTTKPLLYGCGIAPNNIVIKVSEEVRDAVNQRKPVVALESTIYTHGFPYPENTNLALHLESVVRLNGGVPATIGVLNGVARVGFSARELTELTASAGKPETRKISRRDLPYILGLGHATSKLNGGTTVSGTMVLAHLANITVFATGGLGGVHRGGELSLDISADLTELGRTRIAVVSSGCKSFLDIPRTLEYLETQGVCVSTFADGREDPVEFPAFWTRESGVLSPLTIRDEAEAAGMIRKYQVRGEGGSPTATHACVQLVSQRSLRLDSGLLFANPIPAEHSITKSEMDFVIAQALRDAEESGSTGSSNTPFVLKRIREITNGGSVAANRALVEANVARGTKVAVYLSDLENVTRTRSSHGANQASLYNTDKKSEIAWTGAGSPELSNQTFVAPSPARDIHFNNNAADVVVAGSLAIDFSCDYIPQNGAAVSSQPRLRTSNPASIRQSLGGVGQNVATALHYLKASVRLCSSIADDFAGYTALQMLAERGLQTAGIQTSTSGSRTAQYVAMNDAQKDLVLGMADMDILENTKGDFDSIWKPQIDECKPKWLVLDANWNPITLRKWLHAAKASGVRVAYEPVSAAKSKRIFPQTDRIEANLATVPNHLVNLATPNALELESMHEAASSAGAFEREDWWRTVDSIGLSSAGSRDKLVSLTNHSLVDQGVPQQSIRLLPFIPCILTTLGEHGVLMTQLLQPGDVRLTNPNSAPFILSHSTDGSDVVGGVYMRLFLPMESVSGDEILSVNGIGDTFLGIIMAGLTRENAKDLADLIDIAQRGSVLTLKSKEAVSPKISILQSAL